MTSHTFLSRDVLRSTDTTDSTKFELVIRQEPESARVYSAKGKEKRPIDPPPIIQLRVHDESDSTQHYLQNPYYFMCAKILNATDKDGPSLGYGDALSGNIVSSLYRLKDLDNTDAGFFVFGDIFMKLEGQFRLKFSLYEVVTSRDRKLEVTYIKSIVSSTFVGYSSKLFPGIMQSTVLSRNFSDQGVRIRPKKENHAQLKRAFQSRTESLQQSRANTLPSLKLPTLEIAVSPSSTVVSNQEKRTSQQTMKAVDHWWCDDRMLQRLGNSHCSTTSMPSALPSRTNFLPSDPGYQRSSKGVPTFLLEVDRDKKRVQRPLLSAQNLSNLLPELVKIEDLNSCISPKKQGGAHQMLDAEDRSDCLSCSTSSSGVPGITVLPSLTSVAFPDANYGPHTSLRPLNLEQTIAAPEHVVTGRDNLPSVRQYQIPLPIQLPPLHMGVTERIVPCQMQASRDTG